MFRYFIVISALFLLQACTSTADQKSNQTSNQSSEELGKFVGTLENGIYKNSSIPVKLNLPKNWSLTLPNKTLVTIGASDKAIKIDPFVRKSYQLLSLRKYEESSVPKGEFNAALIFSVIDNPIYVESTTAKAHIQSIFERVKLSRKNYQIDKSYNKELAGKNFYILSTSRDVTPSVKLYQDYYSITVDERLISFITIYHDEKDRQQFDSIMASLEFK